VLKKQIIFVFGFSYFVFGAEHQVLSPTKN